MIVEFQICDLDQKNLYYKINNCLNLETNNERKFAGVYAIYKNDICLYVGQSKNLPSRVASHIFGKYKTCDFIKCIDICNAGFSDFFERSDKARAEILNNAEISLMQLLTPTENIITDYTIKLSDNIKPNFDDFYDFVIDYRANDAGVIRVATDNESIIVFADFISICHYQNTEATLGEVNKKFQDLQIPFYFEGGK
jgi:hypothetical protein